MPACRATPVPRCTARRKAACRNLSRALALELAPLGVRVNAVCPGDVDSPMLRGQAAASTDPAAYLDKLLRGYPQGAIGPVHRPRGDRRADLVPRAAFGGGDHRRQHLDRLRPVGRHHVSKAVTTPLDDTDRRLIEALQHDGRASYADLAELVSLSPAATRLRVQRLLDAGVVKVVGVTDPLALGYPVMAALGVRVERNVREVADRIADIAGVIYVVFTSGSFDLLVEVRVRGLGAPADGDRRRDHGPSTACAAWRASPTSASTPTDSCGAPGNTKTTSLQCRDESTAAPLTWLRQSLPARCVRRDRRVRRRQVGRTNRAVRQRRSPRLCPLPPSPRQRANLACHACC